MDQPELNTRLSQLWQQSPPDQRLLVAYVGDTHLLRSSEDRPKVLEQFPSTEWAFQRLQPVLRELMSLAVRPQLVILGGDMTDTAEPGEWKRVFELLKLLDIPWLLTLGNHDHEGAVNCPFLMRTRRALLDHGLNDSVMEDFWCYQRKVGPYQFVMLDSLESEALGPAQHEFLQTALASGEPTIISCHRPIIEVGNWMDQYRLLDDTYVQILSQAKGVLAVLSGHTHKSCATHLAGSWHLVNPAVCYGIDDGTGYRLLCLAEGRLIWTALRLMGGPSQHEFKAPVVQQTAAFDVQQVTN